MKKLLLLALLICSCGSGNLSNSKAEDIISDCLEKEPILRTVTIRLKKNRITGNELTKYEKLKKDGYLEMEPVKNNAKKPVKGKSGDALAQWTYETQLKVYKNKYKNTYNLKLTREAEKHIENAPENSNSVKIKTFRYEVDKVLEVQEIPAMNTAKVKVQYKAVDITPFAILSRKDPAEFWVKDITMTKTSNGWKYCDNF